jgi:hypothetical protein
MFKLKVVLGVAAFVVSAAALTVVVPGRGEAQVGSTPVRVVNTPLPVSGSVNAAVTGDVNANVTGQVTVSNPSNNPVLIRDVDGDGKKELWQTNKIMLIPAGTTFASLVFDPVPAGKALVLEHINIFFQEQSNFSQAPYYLGINNTSSFSALAQSDGQFFPPHQFGIGYVGQGETTFYVASGLNLRVNALRVTGSGQASLSATATGYFIKYP